MAVVVFLCIGMSTLSDPEPSSSAVSYEPRVYDDVATEYALEVFHDNVKLKNESSFVLNDSYVYSSTYNEDDNKYAKVTVSLDYSAQNGLGGMNRSSYTVYLIYSFQTDSYRVDYDLMNLYY